MSILVMFVVLATNVWASETGPQIAREAAALLESERNTISIFKNSADSVVNVSNIQIARRGFFDLDPTEMPSGAGSGFIWDDQGHIVTNFHVIRGGDKFIINYHNDN